MGLPLRHWCSNVDRMARTRTRANNNTMAQTRELHIEYNSSWTGDIPENAMFISLRDRAWNHEVWHRQTHCQEWRSLGFADSFVRNLSVRIRSSAKKGFTCCIFRFIPPPCTIHLWYSPEKLNPMTHHRTLRVTTCRQYCRSLPTFFAGRHRLFQAASTIRHECLAEDQSSY